jgi:amino acid adenylation domain-containing protein
MSKRNIEAIYPLSPMQQGMLFHSLYEPESGVYCEVSSCEISGHLNLSDFQRAWQSVVDRHSILRTSFVLKKLDRMLQVVHKQVTFPMQFLDWREKEPGQLINLIDQLIEQERKLGFDLSKPPLTRLTLVQTSDDSFRLLWVIHHAIIDGWSLPIILKDVMSFYESYKAGQTITLHPVSPYRDYISWLQQQDNSKARKFWESRLSGFSKPSYLSMKESDSKKTSEKSYQEEEVILSKEDTSVITKFIRSNQLTLNSLMQAVLALLISRYSGEQDVVFGSTVSGRPAELPDSESMVGLFINTIPVRIQIPPESSVIEWLRSFQAQLAESRQFEYSPLFEMQEYSGLPGGLPLFDTIFVFENYPVDESVKKLNISLKIKDFKAKEQTNYPLTIVSSPGDVIKIKISYDTTLSEAYYIRRILKQFGILLKNFVAQPDIPVTLISMLEEGEEDLLLNGLNHTDVDFGFHGCIHDLIEIQVRKNPENIALIDEKRQVTYRELDDLSNQLAIYLQKQGILPDECVGVCIDRSCEMIIGILGILKAGAAYVPLEPRYPVDRIAFMAEDANVRYILCQSNKLEFLSHISRVKICFDLESEKISRESGLPQKVTTPANLCYVIYTSGSTGQPKGVMIEHHSLVNLALAQAKYYSLTDQDRLLQFISLSFDAAGEEIYPALITGAALILPAVDFDFSAKPFIEYCEKTKITVLHFPVALWHQLVNEVEKSMLTLPSELRLTVVGGESPSITWLKAWNAACCRTRLSHEFEFVNAYGPTETTISALNYKISSTEAENGSMRVIPVGRPISNLKVYVLDQYQQLVPLGIPGELYIGGEGVARGYINQPALNEVVFIENPYTPGKIIYRTGDIVKYLPNGNIEFIGRVDQQVKIRGYRVELQEIEKSLLTIPGILDATLDIRQFDSGTHIVGYIVPGVSGLNNEFLRSMLSEKLPGYMIPSVFISLDQIPKTPTGKIDRRSLPDPEFSELSTEYTGPRNPIEEVLVSIWEVILGRTGIGIHGNFFELGGHSLLATQLASRIRDTFEIEIPLKDIFANPTISDLAGVIKSIKITSETLQIPPLVAQPRSDEIPLSYSQQRLWFLDQLSPGNLFYNIPIVLKLKGKIDLAIFSWSLNQIVRRHEVLRTTYKTINGKPIQVVHQVIQVDMPMVDVSDQNTPAELSTLDEMVQNEISIPFDLSKGPLLRTKMIKIAESEFIFICTMHHIITDAWSVAIMVKEMVQLYDVFLTTQSEAEALSILPALPIQYADYSIWQRNWLQGDELEKQLKYWTQQLEAMPRILDLPTDHPRPAMQSSKGGSISFTFPADLTIKIKQLSRNSGVTLYITLLAGFQALLNRYCSQDDILVGTPVANRNHVEIEKLIGFFVNTLVIRASFSEKPSFRDHLKRVRHTALDAFSHQDFPFELLVEALQPERDLSHTPIFQAAFSLQTVSMPELAIQNVEISPYVVSDNNAKFDLTLVMEEQSDHLSGTLEYNADLFEENTIVGMMRHFEVLFEGIVANPDEAISNLPILSPAEINLILDEWNRTEMPAPVDRCAHELFEDWVEIYPEATALLFQGRQVTYLELDHLSNQLAHFLRKLGVGPEVLVGISTERSVEMMVGVLGIMKAGGAYLPLDPSYPSDRLTFMLEDSQIRILLSQSHISGHLPEHQAKIINLDTDWDDISRESVTKQATGVNPGTLAYMIYTSGSTGRPKGTMLMHRGLSNLTAAQREVFNIRKGSRILQFSPYSFDASVWETFMALANGATLCLLPQDILSSGLDLARALADLKVTNMTLPPSVLRVLPETQLPEMETVIAAGEACTPELVAKWAPGRKFYNAYGPTETTVCATMFLCDEKDPLPPPIGRPIANAKVYILDRNLQPVPIGVPGELHISGVSLARGYWNRPDVTAEKFIDNPFLPGTRLYKTGDLVKYRYDGNIEFLGRVDQQVKVRGFRIELGEIENVINNHPDIRESVVIAAGRDLQEKKLVGYIVIEDSRPVSINELKLFMRQTLPEYMIPSAFVVMDVFPLSPSGKVDRHALPEPESTRLLDIKYTPPRNEQEEIMVKICAELLHLERVGVFDNFFDLGGHSLLATQFIARLRDEFLIEIPLRSLFENPTVDRLSSFITQFKQENETESERISRLMKKIDHLSEEEIRALLAAKKAVVNKDRS